MPAMVCRASPRTLRTRTRFNSLLYRYIFSEIRSRNTTGMVSSAPVTARFWPFMPRILPRNSWTSGWATMACRCSMGRASKARRPMGRERMLIWVSMCTSPLTFSRFSGVLAAGAWRSRSASSVSRCSMSADRVCLAVSWAVLSASKASTSAVTAASCSALPGSTSPMAVSSSASRVLNSASFSSKAFSSLRLASSCRFRIRIFSMIFLLSLQKIVVYQASTWTPRSLASVLAFQASLRRFFRSANSVRRTSTEVSV